MPAKNAKQIVTIQAQIRWFARLDTATRRWLAVCPQLNLNAVGDTFEELQACGNEAMRLLFIDLFEEGDLATFLRKNGWKMVGEPVPGTTPRFDVPADWKSDARRDELIAAIA